MGYDVIKWSPAVVLLLFVAGGCDNGPAEPPVVEVFSGKLIVKPFGVAWADTDAVVFTVEGGQYSLKHTINNSSLCNSNGNVADFGKNRIRLTPTSFGSTSNCDSLHVPQGWFKAVFRGDSLLLGPDTQIISHQSVDTMVYSFRLAK